MLDDRIKNHIGFYNQKKKLVELKSQEFMNKFLKPFTPKSFRTPS
jgi:hypothetical protein